MTDDIPPSTVDEATRARLTELCEPWQTVWMEDPDDPTWVPSMSSFALTGEQIADRILASDWLATVRTATTTPAVDDLEAVIYNHRLGAAGGCMGCDWDEPHLTYEAHRTAHERHLAKQLRNAIAPAPTDDLVDGQQVRVVRTERLTMTGTLRRDDPRTDAPFALLTGDTWVRLHPQGKDFADESIQDRIEAQP